jgi:hypothetical protein
MSRESRWVIGIFALLTGTVLVWVAVPIGSELPAGPVPIAAVGIVALVMAVACFFPSSWPVTLRIIGFAVCLASIWFVIASIGTPNLLTAVLALFAIGLPFAVMGVLGRLPGWEGGLNAMPREDSVVAIDERGVTCRRPDGKKEEVTWDELTSVEIVTTDGGPFVEDVFWVLHGADRGCVVPQEAEGCKELLERLQKLPGFNNQAVINAMGCTSNAHLLAWQREGSGDSGGSGGKPKDAAGTETADSLSSI